MEIIATSEMRNDVATFRGHRTGMAASKARILANVPDDAIRERLAGNSVAIVAADGTTLGNLATVGSKRAIPATTDHAAVVADIRAMLESGQTVTLADLRESIANHYVARIDATAGTSVSVTIK